jgi:hypothetical protein
MPFSRTMNNAGSRRRFKGSIISRCTCSCDVIRKKLRSSSPTDLPALWQQPGDSSIASEMAHETRMPQR